MAIFDLFSKRQKRLRGELPDVFTYDEIPTRLRAQIIHIIRDALGNPRSYNSPTARLYQAIHDALCREYGLFQLSNEKYHEVDHISDTLNFILGEKETEKVLDAIELSFKIIDTACREYGHTNYADAKIEPDDAIKELNDRFRENGVGFQFESRELIRIDSQIIHAETVKPALALLRGRQYKGANEEFLSAFEHYRHGRNKEALNDALKSFESTLKAIFNERKWAFAPTDTASRLLTICFENELIPSLLQSHFVSLKSNLESGVPTLRNKLGGHGQGSEPIVVPQYLTAFQLHITASAILMLVEAHNAK